MASNSDDANVMDLSLPPSGNSSRLDTPSYSNCRRLQAIAMDIKKFTNLTNGTETMIKTMHLDGFTSDDDPSLQDLNCGLAHYKNYLDMASNRQSQVTLSTSHIRIENPGIFRQDYASTTDSHFNQSGNSNVPTNQEDSPLQQVPSTFRQHSLFCYGTEERALRSMFQKNISQKNIGH
ncbi:hypothetical protein TNCT_626851 [Trichonephila clavata]|uniref:Uncharacterized protein n=1 Tax=Trichonephila clavata TaxID=2740835 RepID=A0A8X6FUM2_TRICU|nr:hypothetical protein TNCT_626851 [Trichonephila clavata]